VCLFGGDLFLFGLHSPGGVFSSGRMPWDIITHTIDSWNVVSRFDGLLIGGKVVGEEIFHFIQLKDVAIVVASELGEVIETHEGLFDNFFEKEISSCEAQSKWNGFL